MMKDGICARVRSADQSGKVFRIEQGMRRCMVCEEFGCKYWHPCVSLGEEESDFRAPTSLSMRERSDAEV